MSGLTLDWSSAEVRKDRLEVALSGEQPKGWKDSFNRTLALLPGGEWGKVRLKKGRIRVNLVTEGCEDRLRHFLESIVLQANAAAEPKDGEGDRGARDEDSGDLNTVLTERFRSFSDDTDRQDDR